MRELHIREESRVNLQKTERESNMKKREGNRKDWIKNVLIIFLVILLLLTFFSNTILNYSLPEVSTVYITSGSISTAIRGSGVIQGVDPYSVTISEGRKVESVAVRKGDTVSKGDVLFILEEGDSTEVTNAKKAYEALLEQYQSTIIDNKISSAVVAAAEAHDHEGLAAKVERLEILGDILSDKEDALGAIDAQMSLLGVTVVDTSAEEAQLEAAKINLEAAQSKLNETSQKVSELEGKYNSVLASFNSLSPEEQAACESETVNQLVAINNAKIEAQNANTAAKSDVERYSNLVTSIEKTISEKKAGPANQSAELAYQRAVAANEKTEAENNYNQLYNEIKYQRELEDLLEQIAEKKEEYERIASKSIGTEVLAPVSGTITSVNVVAGEKVAADTTMAVIQLSGKEYTMEMTVTREQAARIRVGDIGQVSNSWYYSDMVLTVSAIKPDTSNPSSGNRIVVFTVTGTDINVGQNVTVSVGDKSANYDMVVPNTAIREDKNGAYILVVTAKSTPIGNRYTATRVDVTKLASDDTYTAISCGLNGWESVITTSTKPVSAGDQVRLPK